MEKENKERKVSLSTYLITLIVLLAIIIGLLFVIQKGNKTQENVISNEAIVNEQNAEIQENIIIEEENKIEENIENNENVIFEENVENKENTIEDNTEKKDSPYTETWSDTDDRTGNIIRVSKIKNNKFDFEVSIYRVTSFNGVAEMGQNKNIATFKITGNKQLNENSYEGTIKFDKNKITLTITKSDFKFIKKGDKFEFKYQLDDDSNL